MKTELRRACLLILVTSGIAVIMETKHPESSDESSMSFVDAFGVCLSKKEYGTLECANRGALSTLQSYSDQEKLDFGSVRLEKAEGFSRELLDLDYDPKDFGNVVQAAARLMERRNLRWNLDYVYPGLQMRIGPMLNGNGVLEFVMNEKTPYQTDRQGGPGRQVARNLLLPFLLGFKFNLASLIPLIFGVILIISKKALLLTKIALLLSSVLGWNSLFSGITGSPAGTLNGFNGFGHGHEIPPSGIHHHEYYPPHRPYRGIEFGPYGQHVIREVVNVYDGESELKQNSRNNKNFAWSTSE